MAQLRIIRAAKNTLDGMVFLWKKEWAFRQEIYYCAIFLPIVMMVQVASALKLLVFLAMLLLLCVEALNSAIEAVVDRISLEPHELSRIAKDMGSAAVGIVIFINFIVWAYTVYSYFHI
jgi:diacylglycerol kinase (ATP)